MNVPPSVIAPIAGAVAALNAHRHHGSLTFGDVPGWFWIAIGVVAYILLLRRR